MAKTITLRYAGKCSDCGTPLPVGTRAKWYGRGRVYGLDCHDRNTSDGRAPRVSSFTTSGGTFTSCNCEDYPCCGH